MIHRVPTKLFEFIYRLIRTGTMNSSVSGTMEICAFPPSKKIVLPKNMFKIYFSALVNHLS